MKFSYKKRFVLQFLLLFVSTNALYSEPEYQESSPTIESKSHFQRSRVYLYEMKARIRDRVDDVFNKKSTKPSSIVKEPETDLSPEDLEIKNKLEKLPAEFQPKNMKLALDYMHAGEKAWEKISSGQTIDAVLNNIDNPEARSTLKEYLQDPTKLSSLTTDPTMKPVLKTFVDAYQKTVIQVQWHLYKKSIETDDRAFAGGMITFPDPNHVLFKFLDNYSMLINPVYKDQSIIQSLLPQSDPAYHRASSHFKGQLIDNKSYGIDLDVSTAELLLPNNMQHILFGERTVNDMTFVKWESHGTRVGKGGLSHGLSFIKTRGENDESLFSKERIPSDITKKFEDLYYDNKVSRSSPSLFNKIFKKVSKTTIGKDTEIYGISRMLEYLEKKDSKLAKEFTEYLTTTRPGRHFDPKTLHIRRGGESIPSIDFKKI